MKILLKVDRNGWTCSFRGDQFLLAAPLMHIWRWEREPLPCPLKTASARSEAGGVHPMPGGVILSYLVYIWDVMWDAGIHHSRLRDSLTDAYTLKCQSEKHKKCKWCKTLYSPADFEKKPIVCFWARRPKSKIICSPDPIYGWLLPWFCLTHSPMDYFKRQGEERVLHLAVSQPPKSILLLLGQVQQLFGEQFTSLPSPISGIRQGTKAFSNFKMETWL